MTKVRHVLGISGGKDSAALAIYLKNLYPELDVEYYTCDTGKELDETYQLITNLEIYLGTKIRLLKASENSSEAPFDHFLKMYGGFLPSSNARWCTKKLKLEPFEKFVGDEDVISYVGIRGDENREGYISTKKNIQSIFPFRKNIWSQDVTTKFLLNQNIEKIRDYINEVDILSNKNTLFKIIKSPITPSYTLTTKLNNLLENNVLDFNKLIFHFLKTTEYPLSKESYFPLINNEDVLIREDIFRILEESGVGVPKYYNKVEFESGSRLGQYSRSRSGCYFCFFQQKIEWVWLYEQHPDLFKKAIEYEKEGYTWNQEESLSELIKPERMMRIKDDYIKKTRKKSEVKSKYLLDILDDTEDEGCASCFI